MVAVDREPARLLLRRRAGGHRFEERATPGRRAPRAVRVDALAGVAAVEDRRESAMVELDELALVGRLAA